MPGLALLARDENGQERVVKFVEASGDVALLRCESEHSVLVWEPRVPTVGDRWVGQARPTDEHVVLTGTVAYASLAFALTAGRSHVHQLTVDQNVGDHRGYSGGPVTSPSTSGTTDVIGLLVEQYPDAVDEDRATNVLFAVTMHEVITLLREFDSLYGSQKSEPTQISRVGRRILGTDEGEISTLLANSDQILRLAARWAKENIITEAQHEMYQLQVQKRIFESLDDRDAGEDGG